MAIQNRRGKEADFDPSKMLPGEFAVTTDGSRKVYAAFAPGDVKELASKEEVQGIVDDFKENVDKQTEEVVQAIDDKGKEVIDRIPDYDTKISTLQQSKATAIVSTLKGEVLNTNSSAAIPPRNLKLFGKSWQESTLGNQLFDTKTYVKNATVSNEEITITEDSTDVYLNGSYNGTVILFSLNAGTYSASCDNSNIRISLYTLDKTYTIDNTNGAATSQIQIDIVGIRIRSIDGTSLKGSTIKIMLNKGNTALPWEPYTGNMPSPNPDYPQEIQSLGSDGSIGGKVLTGNVLKYSYPIGYTETKNGITFTILDDGGINVVGTNTSDGDTSLHILAIGDYSIPDGGYTLFVKGCNNGIIFGMWNNWKPFFVGKEVYVSTDTYTLSGTCIDCMPHFGVFVKPNATVNTTIYTMLNVGSEPLPYESYTEQPFTVLTPNGFNGLEKDKNSTNNDDLLDYVDSDGRKYITDKVALSDGKLVKRIKEFGIEDSTYIGVKAFGENGYSEFSCNMPFTFVEQDYQSLSTHFKRMYAYRKEEEYFYISQTTLRVYTNKFSTVEDFTAWYVSQEENGTPVRFYGVLANQIETDLTAEEIAQYQALCMNYPNTTIVNDAGAYMEVEYVEDTELYLAGNYVPISEHNALASRVSALEQMALN